MVLVKSAGSFGLAQAGADGGTHAPSKQLNEPLGQSDATEQPEVAGIQTWRVAGSPINPVD